jgi:L-ascorbate metabolism protein UlaG (beta-lactamase superfamily)
MTNNKVYLKSNVVAEPLFNQWYAGAYLVAPATAAMFTANAHLKILQSFISAPQVHVSALKNPALRGGPFVNLGPDKIDDVKTLLEKTVAGQSHLLNFARAVMELNELLSREATGYSLESVYQKVPEALKGYVELVYDLNNHPSFRFVEGLLYQSPYYDLSLQSVSLSLNLSADRLYDFSTPRLARPDVLNVRLPFHHEGYDEMFKMRREPQLIGYIRERLGIDLSDGDLLWGLFDDKSPAIAPPYEGGGVRIRYFGHACILLETKDTSVLCDPLISYGLDKSEANYTYDDLPREIDHVVITQNHQDRFALESLLQLRHKIKSVFVPRNNGGALADPSLKLLLRKLGFSNVEEMGEMERVEVQGGSITGLPFLGNHADLNIGSKLAYLITLRDKTLVCAADLNTPEPKLLKVLKDTVGDVDVLFIGMQCDGVPMSWLYGPLLTMQLARKMDQSRRLAGPSYERSLSIVDGLKPKHVYVYGMGQMYGMKQEPGSSNISDFRYTESARLISVSDGFVTECRLRGLTSERLISHREITLS